MEIKVEEKNRKYGNYLKEILCGKDSDLVTFLLFKYEYMYFNKSDNLFASNMNKLSNDSLTHIEILGKLITLLGDKPDLIPNNNINSLY